ncbi:SH3 domain-containing protein [Andreprevotia lacus DSM 23236]|jgi:SH3-like domain-containing protein|uniref:SH3 domain-containing protein n=1 Tax=Andreprevotia lacus DSM 23236 TaxID=1121001 RepID=A0A1W1Y0V8_9NEIS|nr:SH3 domain-containing protein [Andreprevotia lacus]SMC29772.1 SH3 domain-containing protein [Andreprevotia lacus DSM 23236]
MHKPRTKLLVLAALALLAGASHALEFRSVARHGAVLYQAPQDDAKKLFVLSRGTPLELLSEENGWLRVRDREGTLAWLKKTDASGKRYVAVLKPVNVYQKPDAGAAVQFKAGKDLLLELVENTRNGWLKVKHRDGQTGYIRIEEAWGA